MFAERTRVIISAAVDVDIPEFGADSAEYQTLLWNDSTTLQRRLRTAWIQVARNAVLSTVIRRSWISATGEIEYAQIALQPRPTYVIFLLYWVSVGKEDSHFCSFAVRGSNFSFPHPPARKFDETTSETAFPIVVAKGEGRTKWLDAPGSAEGRSGHESLGFGWQPYFK